MCTETGKCEPLPPGSSCVNPRELLLDTPVSGNTLDPRVESGFKLIGCGGISDVPENLGSASPENIYRFVPEVDGEYTFRLAGVSWNAVFFVSEQYSETRACWDTVGADTCLEYVLLDPDADNDGAWDPVSADLTVPLNANVNYYVFVDGAVGDGTYDYTGYGGSYTLSVTR